jgi:hypothetical protein
LASCACKLFEQRALPVIKSFVEQRTICPRALASS